MGRKIPVVPQPLHNKHVSHHSILPQAESQVTNNNSQLGSHMAPNMSNPTPSRNMSVARSSNTTPNRGAHQFGIRAGIPGGGIAQIAQVQTLTHRIKIDIVDSMMMEMEGEMKIGDIIV